MLLTCLANTVFMHCWQLATVVLWENLWGIAYFIFFEKQTECDVISKRKEEDIIRHLLFKITLQMGGKFFSNGKW